MYQILPDKARIFFSKAHYNISTALVNRYYMHMLDKELGSTNNVSIKLSLPQTYRTKIDKGAKHQNLR